MLSKDKLLSAGLNRQEVRLPSLDETVVVREMSLAELDQFAQVERSAAERSEFLIRHSLVEPAGDDDDVVRHLLEAAPRDILEEILGAINTVNGFSGDEQEEV